MTLNVLAADLDLHSTFSSNQGTTWWLKRGESFDPGCRTEFCCGVAVNLEPVAGRKRVPRRLTVCEPHIPND
jgi:hypothetical protein